MKKLLTESAIHLQILTTCCRNGTTIACIKFETTVNLMSGLCQQIAEYPDRCTESLPLIKIAVRNYHIGSDVLTGAETSLQILISACNFL